MKRDKLCSIIIPNYNSNKKLNKTFKSLFEQDKELYELIIVDSCSTDESVELIKKYEWLIDKTIIEKDNGIYDAMNKGINCASGEYIYFLGAGDTLASGILKTIEVKLIKKGCNLIYGNVYFGEDKKNICYGKFNKLKLSKKNICHQAIFYSYNIFDLIGFYDTKYRILSDYAFNILCFGNKTIKKIYINDIIATFELNGISSNNVDKEFYKDYFQLIKRNLGMYIWIIRIFRNRIRNMVKRISRKR